MRSLSFLSKMTIFGFLLGTLPVIFIGAFAYMTSSSEIQENVVNGNRQLLMQINSNVEQKLTTVNHTLNQVIHSTVLKKAMNQPLAADDFMTYNDIQNEIRYMQSFDTKLEDVILINERHNWMVKNSGLYAFDRYPFREQLASLRDIPEGVSWVLTPTEWFYSEENARGTVACPYIISLVKKLPTAGLEKYGLAIANIPACGLQELLETEASDAPIAEMIILDEQNRILLHRDPSLIGQPAEAAGMPAERLTEASGEFVVSAEQGKQSVTYYRSELNGWHYLSVSSIAAMTKESVKIGQYTLYICLFMLLLSMLLAWIGSRRMYSPIQTLLAQVGELMTDAGKRRNRNEFQVISERVHHLFQSKSQLEKEVQQHVQQARAFFLMRALQGNVRGGAIPERLRQFGYAEQLEGWRTMAVMALQIDFQEDSRYSKGDLELLLFAIHNIIEELVPSRERLAPVTMDGSIVAVIGSEAEDEALFYDKMRAVTELVQSQVAGYLNLQVSIGISLPFVAFDHLAVACREGNEALKQRMKLGTGIIIQYEHLNQEGTHTLNLSYPSYIENELLDAIKLAEKEAAKELLKQFLQTVFAEELSPQEYQIPLARLLNSLLVVMQESGVGLGQIHPMKGSLLEELLGLHTHAEIEDWFWTGVAHPMVKIFRDRREAQYHNISEKIIDLVQHHYDSDLTLEECASRLHYNANYLSSVFRKETGHSFSEYLTMYRFNMAKRWLADGEMPIKDIAAKLRYNNPQNFIRSFRKQEGITPGQYRERKRSG
ncbi:helix-turn-helix domain-containing protein [Paenibacillus sp. LHD-117]|uniref:helix-turn-helix domain-containing protein n=1 Tax=Paenibacillus sp. LHD-117 TaxID=3071412 RepID=UPI0027E051D2|nr:helix-turn-helix domain-containing protein [Paenibacillus sp. LHD-117]MDQ6418743.1 helix-turn-helix domain-containing protein [Paenibacillus sp. LHD-117]